MATVMAMTVVFLLAIVVTTSPAKAIDCTSVVSHVNPCMNFLRNPNMAALPETKCCDAAKKLIDFENVDNLCGCFRPLGSAFLLSKAQRLPDLCNSNSFSPLVKCLSPSPDDSGGLLPPLPLFPLPPLPLFPLPPLPLFPLPPLPFPPLLPLVPPVANQDNVQSHDVGLRDLQRQLPLAPHPPQPNIPFPPLAKNIKEEKKNMQSQDVGVDTLLPPLPLVPLPPLPNIPLPPLPKIPLPPLPLLPPVAKNLEQEQNNVKSHDVSLDALLPPLPLVPLPPLPNIPLPPLPKLPLPPLPLVPPIGGEA